MTLAERKPASYPYPSPTSETHNQPLPSPHNAYVHPSLHRSDSMPGHMHSRPGMHRTASTPASGEFLLSNPVGMARPSDGRNEEEEREELTTKGRKRKRLAKACSACHKNKRRCDGFAPCSNCEFSSRPCLYVNAQGEVIPPPRTRDSVKKESTNGTPSKSNGEFPSNSSPEKKDGAPPPPPNDRAPRKNSGGARGDKADKESRGFVDPLEAVDRDTTLSAEMVDIFFNHVHPYAAMLHGPTFNYRLFLGRTSPLLLDAIYALSAHLCLNPVFLSTISASVPTWARGEVFAERAHHTAKRLIDVRSSMSEEEKRLDKGTWEETEFVQALYLLSVYYASVRQTSLGLYFLDVAIDILRPASTASLVPPPTHLGLSTIDYLTLMECRNRTFWMLVLHDLCAAANGRPRRLLDHELYNVPLPGDESQWDRWGGGGSSGREGSRRDGLAVGTGTWLGEEGQIGELGHVLRVLVVFSDIMTVANNGGPGSDARGTPAQHEQALKSWALSLPRSLRFDENTLTTSVTRLSSSLHITSRSAWLFAYMHAIAECGMFYLQAALATNGASWTAQRQSQAVDNIAVILEAVGVRGRESPLMLFPLMVVSNWHDHLRSSPAPPTAQQMLLDERLGTWWSEAARDWGYERVSTMDRGLYQPQPITHTAPALPPPSPLAPPVSGLGLYGTSPIRAPESAISLASSSSTTLTTPTTSTSFIHLAPGNATHRYSTAQLPPLRQRANTLGTLTPFTGTVPSISASSPRSSIGHAAMVVPLANERKSHRSIPSMALTDPNPEIKLPPLPPMDPSPREGGAFKFPSFWNSSERAAERERERERGADKSSLTTLSPRFNPYSRDKPPTLGVNSVNGHGNGTGSSPRKAVVVEDKRPRSPISQPREREREEKREPDSAEVPCGPVGIAALISAAEEKSRERETGLGFRISV